jgi:3-oxoadipate enol-lactonase
MITYLKGDPFKYVDVGNPASLPVVFIHGFPFSHEMWKPQLDVVGARYRARAYDARGHGSSYVGDGQFTIEGHVDDLIELLDTLTLSRVVVVGLSMGGYVALRALERNPERFSAAVLCDTRSDVDGNEGKLKRFASIRGVKSTGSATFAEGFVKAVFAPGSLQTMPDTVNAIRTVISQTSPLSIAGTLLALASRTDTTASLASIKVPTLIMVGEFDQTTPPAASDRKSVV